MTPVHQTIFGDGKGNCWAACIASILDLPIAQVPNLCGEPERNDAWLIHDPHPSGDGIRDKWCDVTVLVKA